MKTIIMAVAFLLAVEGDLQKTGNDTGYGGGHRRKHSGRTYHKGGYGEYSGGGQDGSYQVGRNEGGYGGGGSGVSGGSSGGGDGINDRRGYSGVSGSETPSGYEIPGWGRIPSEIPGWIFQPDATDTGSLGYSTPLPEYTEEIVPSYKPEINSIGTPGSPGYYDIVGVGEPGERGYFKRTPGPSGDPNDYNLEPIVSPDNPVPVNPTDKNAPKVHKSKHGRYLVMQVGSVDNKKYFRLRADPDKPGKYSILPQRLEKHPNKPIQQPQKP